MANDSNIGITLTANATGVEQALQKMQTALDKTIDKLNTVEKQSKQSSDRAADGFEKAAASTMKFVGAAVGLGSMGAALAAINRELKEVAVNQEAVRAAMTNSAQAVASLKMNFSGDKTLSSANLERRLEAIARATKTNVGSVADVASAVLSAGPATNEQGMATVEAALALQPGNVTAARELGARAINLAGPSGVTDPKALLGFMTNIQQQSNVRDISQLGANGLPAILAAMARGDTAERAGETFAALSKIKADAQGATTGTAQRALVDQLMEFVPGKSGKDAQGRFRVGADQISAFTSARSPSERVDVLRANADLRRAFMSKASFGESSAAVGAFLSGDPAAMAVVRQVQAGIAPLDAGQAANYNAKLADIASGRYQATLTAEQQSGANIEGFMLNSSYSARAATARKVYSETLQKAGFGYMERGVDNASLEARMMFMQNPEEAAANDLRSKAGVLRSSDQNFGLSENKERVAQLLERQAALLEESLKEAKRTNDLMREQNGAIKSDINSRPQKPITVPSAGLGTR